MNNQIHKSAQAESQIKCTVELAPTTQIVIPKRKPGAQSARAKEVYEAEVEAFCAAIIEIRSNLDFAVSSRGLCYILESHGLAKGDFDIGQKFINECRKSGRLPLNICAEDTRRSAHNLEEIDNADPEEEGKDLIQGLREAHETYFPFSFWDDKDHYIEVMVEKIDLRSLFGPICKEYCIPISNAVGWSDLNQRRRIMKRFAKWEAKGKQCVLLYCGDFDPAGLVISDFLRSNMKEIEDAVKWSPDNLIIKRFGLSYEFIIEQGLTWIDNLETSSGKYPLNDRRHADHKKPYVQNYLKRYGVRKVEANALVVRTQEGRELCRAAINQYVSEDAPEDYRRTMEPKGEELRQIIETALGPQEAE